MFQIKKDNYNSVQLLPDYSSSSVRSNASFRRSRHFGVVAVILIVILLAAALAGGGFLYFTQLSPAKSFQRALASQDFEKCTQLSQENSFDEAFVEEIRTPVITEAEGVLAAYREGTLKSDEAIRQLQNLDTISDGAFQESISGMISTINASEQVFAAFSDAQSTLLSGKYLEGVGKLMTAAAAASQNGVDLENEISTTLSDHQYSIKAELFRQFAILIRQAAYSQITSYIDFVSPYMGDSDFGDFRTMVASVQAGTEKSKNVSKKALTIAANAENAARAQQQAAEPQSGTQE